MMIQRNRKLVRNDAKLRDTRLLPAIVRTSVTTLIYDRTFFVWALLVTTLPFRMIVFRAFPPRRHLRRHRSRRQSILLVQSR